jgi:hypothetical protein
MRWPGRTMQQVGAQAGDLVLHRLRGAVAQRDHGDHRADADHDAQDGQERAQQVAPDRTQGEQEGVQQHQAILRMTAQRVRLEPGGAGWRSSAIHHAPSTKRTMRRA